MVMSTPILRNFKDITRISLLLPEPSAEQAQKRLMGNQLVRSNQAIVAAIAICATGAQTSAAAQEFDSRTAIEDRARPEYASPPISVGAFEVVPRIEVGTEYVDNLFASDQFNVDDIILTSRASVSVADRRTDREIRLNLSAGYQTFLDNNASDRVVLNARLRGRLGLGTATRPYVGAMFRRNETSSVGLDPGSDPAQPIRNTAYGINLGIAQDIGNFTLETEGRANDYQYDGQIVFQNQSFDANFRDYAYYEGRVRASYSSRPDQRFYVEGRYGKFDSANSTLTAPPTSGNFFLFDRSGTNLSLVGGIQFQITEVLSVDANVGYTELSFDDPRQPAVSGLSFETIAYYSPSRLTRFQLRATRSVDDTLNPLFSTFLRTGVSVLGEHELLRNLILRAEAEYTQFSAGDLDIDGEEFRTSFGAVYYVSPHVSLRLRGELFDRSGIAPGTQRRALISLGYDF